MHLHQFDLNLDIEVISSEVLRVVGRKFNFDLKILKGVWLMFLESLGID